MLRRNQKLSVKLPLQGSNAQTESPNGQYCTHEMAAGIFPYLQGLVTKSWGDKVGHAYIKLRIFENKNRLLQDHFVISWVGP